MMIELLQQWGVLGLFLGSFLAATVVPFSSDVLLVGALAAGCDPVSCIVSATVGNWLGGMSSYLLGWLGRWEWLERWLHVKPETLERQRERVSRWGVWLALLTWVPVVGDIFAIALGFYRVAPLRCALFILIGKAVRYIAWAGIYWGVVG